MRWYYFANGYSISIATWLAVPFQKVKMATTNDGACVDAWLSYLQLFQSRHLAKDVLR